MVGRFVDGAEPIAGHVGVDLGGCEICVAEELLDCPEVGSAFEQVRSVCVAQRMRVDGTAVGQRVPLEDAAGVTRGEHPAALVQEHEIAR